MGRAEGGTESSESACAYPVGTDAQARHLPRVGWLVWNLIHEPDFFTINTACTAPGPREECDGAVPDALPPWADFTKYGGDEKHEY